MNAEGETLLPALRWPQAEEYLSSLAGRGYAESTIATYRHNLRHFFASLPPDGRLQHDTVRRWRDGLLAEGYKPRTINLRLAAVNGFLDYADLRAYQVPDQLQKETTETATLDRSGYLSLLLAAQSLGDQRSYLLVKVLTLLGLSVGELDRLTVEAVRDGRVDDRCPIPPSLLKELEAYISQEQLQKGALFVTRDGAPIYRGLVNARLRVLADASHLPRAQCTPRALHRLWQQTREAINQEVAQIVEQFYDRLLEQEQLTLDWAMSQRE